LRALHHFATRKAAFGFANFSPSDFAYALPLVTAIVIGSLTIGSLGHQAIGSSGALGF
jgi:hypothetical protein